MKFAAVFVCCIFGVFWGEVSSENLFPQEVIDMIINLSNTCKEETGVAQSVVDELRKANLVDDPKGKCYLKCMMRQLQTMKEDGTLDIELIEATMPEVIKNHGGMETVMKCKDIHEADICETAFKIMHCFKNENPTLAALFE